MSLSCFSQMIISTRMHSSRMRTVRSSGRIWGGASAPGGMCLLWGVSGRRAVCVWSWAVGGVWSQGVCVWSQGVCVWSRGCLLGEVSGPRGVYSGGVSGPGGVCSQRGSAPRGVCSRGVSAQGGVCSGGSIPAWTEADTPTPHVDRQTDACKNITFATSLRTVISSVITR